MNIPTDYPVTSLRKETTVDTTTADITYADLKNRVDAKQLVTDEMIRTARARLDAAHIEPTKTEQDKFILRSIRNRFRPE